MTTAGDIWTVVEPYLAAERVELDDVEMLGRGPGQIVRVTVDGDGIGVDRLAELSRGISRLLDHETSLTDSYQLEVSSPGLERKLRRPGQFRKAVGREVVAKVASGESKRTVRGMIANADEGSFTVETDGDTVVISYPDLLSAHTVFRWEKAPKPGH